MSEDANQGGLTLKTTLLATTLHCMDVPTGSKIIHAMRPYTDISQVVITAQSTVVNVPPGSCTSTGLLPAELSYIKTSFLSFFFFF